MQYRVYEAERNAGGGLEPTGHDEYVEAASAREAAEIMALKWRQMAATHGEDVSATVAVATDDDGESDVCSLTEAAD